MFNNMVSCAPDRVMMNNCSYPLTHINCMLYSIFKISTKFPVTMSNTRADDPPRCRRDDPRIRRGVLTAHFHALLDHNLSVGGNQGYSRLVLRTYWEVSAPCWCHYVINDYICANEQCDIETYCAQSIYRVAQYISCSPSGQLLDDVMLICYYMLSMSIFSCFDHEHKHNSLYSYFLPNPTAVDVVSVLRQFLCYYVEISGTKMIKIVGIQTCLTPI